MSRRGRRVVVVLCLGLGLFLVWTGLLLMVAPDAGERAFGIVMSDAGSHAFHVATGVRQVCLGLLIGILALTCEFRALGILLLILSAIPATDALIVLAEPTGGLGPALARHAPSVPLTLTLGSWLLWTPRSDRKPDESANASDQ